MAPGRPSKAAEAPRVRTGSRQHPALSFRGTPASSSCSETSNGSGIHDDSGALYTVEAGVADGRVTRQVLDVQQAPGEKIRTSGDADDRLSVVLLTRFKAAPWPSPTLGACASILDFV